ncbi:MAG: hypothetical protein WCN92_04360 [Eubacteriales bacterium]
MIKSLIISLTITVLIENAGAAMLGVRKKRDFLLITLVNIAEAEGEAIRITATNEA